MKKKYIVRADFYPNGQINPLGVTTFDGRTIYINHVIFYKTEILENGSTQNIFHCCTNDGLLTLGFTNNQWNLIDIKHQNP